MEYWTTQEAARALGITRLGVLKRIGRGKLKAVKFGRDWMLDKEEVLTSQAIRGRPKKEKATCPPNEKTPAGA